MSGERKPFWQIALAWAAVAAVAAAADPQAEFAKVRRDIQRQLASPQASERAAALVRLAEVPVAESVRLIQRGLDDPDPEVQASAFTALLSLSDNLEVCRSLLNTVRRAFQQPDESTHVAPLLAVLVSSSLPAVEREVNTLLDNAGGHGAEVMLMALADHLGLDGQEPNVAPLAGLAKSKAFRESFGVRRAVVDALTRIQSPRAIGALIELLDSLQGEASADAVEHLSFVTEQVYGFEAAAWQEWWKTAAATFKYPEKKPVTPYRDGSLESPGGEYYGLPIFAEKLVFVFDTSGSMAGERIVLAKRELVRAIKGLPEDAYFSVVVFNTYVDAWQRQLVKATSQAKQGAIAYVEAQMPRANTASYDALEAAFQFDTEAIYFVSDGAPHGGKIAAPVDIVAAVSQANTARRVSLYTIGIAVGFAGNPLDVFLAELAKNNYGVYRRVDE